MNILGNAGLELRSGCPGETNGEGGGLETAEIQRAIDDAGRCGGGVVRIRPGIHRTSTLRLRSRVTLLVEPGATLLGHDDPESYEAITRIGGDDRLPRRWNRSLLLCDNVEDVTITGGGVIDGGDVFDPEGEERMRGPHTILLHESKRVRIADVRIQRSANYAILFYDSDRVDIERVTVEGGWDGVHFRGRKGRPCRDVTISGCRFYTGDDAIAGCYWDNVVIEKCLLNSSCNGIRLIGPAKDLLIHQCLIYGPGRFPHRTFDNRNSLGGILLQPGAWMKTEGELDGVVISDITMHRVQTPFQFVLKHGNTGGRITVSRVDAHGVYHAASSVESWAEEPFGEVTFRNVSIDCESSCDDPSAPSVVAQPHVGIRPLPAWAMYARGVRKLSLQDVRFTISGQSVQPALFCEQVGCLELDHLILPSNVDRETGIRLERVERVEQRNNTTSPCSPSQIPIQAATRPQSSTTKP